MTLKPCTWKSSGMCTCHASFYFVIVGVVFSLTIKLLVLPHGLLPTLFFKALVGRRPCEPSEQTIPAMSTHFENIFWALTNLMSDSQLEV